jgi:hypothetical protein
MRVKIPRKPHKDGHCKPSEAHSGRMTKIDMKPSKALKSPQTTPQGLTFSMLDTVPNWYEIPIHTRLVKPVQ